MCRLRTRSWQAASPRVPQEARGWARQVLASWSVQDPDDDVALVLTELVTNSLRHAGPPVDVTLAVVGGVVDLSVTDQSRPAAPGDSTPVTRRGRSHPAGAVPLAAVPGAVPDPVPPVVFSHAPAPAAPARTLLDEQRVAGVPEDGRGLFLVDAAAETWAVAPTSRGSRAWVRLDVDPAWRFAEACTCDPSNPAAVRLASGAFVVPMPIF